MATLTGEEAAVLLWAVVLGAGGLGWLIGCFMAWRDRRRQ